MHFIDHTTEMFLPVKRGVEDDTQIEIRVSLMDDRTI